MHLAARDCRSLTTLPRTDFALSVTPTSWSMMAISNESVPPLRSGLGVYCGRWKLPHGMPKTFQIMGEPTACWLHRNREVTRVNLTAVLTRDGGVSYADAAEAEFSRRIAVRDSALAGREPSGGLFMFVSHRHTVEYVACARMLKLSAAHWLVSRASLLLYVNKPELDVDMMAGYLKAFPMRGLRMLAKTDQNAGYR